jgi:aryl-alcohol dehydrogenase-like predicted oxidoreductase
MRTRKLRDLEVSAVGFGCMGFSHGYGPTPERQESINLIRYAQSEYSMMERMFERDVIPLCKELRIGFVPFSPLASGFLSGKVRADDQYVGDDVRRVITRFDRGNIVANQPLVTLLRRFADEKHATPAQIALAWMLAKENSIAPIPGARKRERIAEDLGAAGVDLTASELEQIETELEKIPIYGNRTDEDIAKLRQMS